MHKTFPAPGACNLHGFTSVETRFWFQSWDSGFRAGALVLELVFPNRQECCWPLRVMQSERVLMLGWWHLSSTMAAKAKPIWRLCPTLISRTSSNTLTLNCAAKLTTGSLKVMDRSKKEMRVYRSELNKAMKKNRELHSLRCDLAHKLRVSLFAPASTACTGAC